MILNKYQINRLKQERGYSITAVVQDENEKLYFQAYVGIDYFKTAKKQNGDGVYFVIYDGEVDADGNIQGTETESVTSV